MYDEYEEMNVKQKIERAQYEAIICVRDNLRAGNPHEAMTAAEVAQRMAFLLKELSVDA